MSKRLARLEEGWLPPVSPMSAARPSAKHGGSCPSKRARLVTESNELEDVSDWEGESLGPAVVEEPGPAVLE